MPEILAVPPSIEICAGGVVALLPTDKEIDSKFTCETDNASTPFDKRLVYSLGATLFVAADYSLEADEVPDLSETFESLLSAMTAEEHETRMALPAIPPACIDHLGPGRAEEVLSALLAAAHAVAGLSAPEAEQGGAGPQDAGQGGAAHGSSSVHAELMESIRSGQTLKHVELDALPKPVVVMTPRDLLLSDIRATNGIIPAAATARAPAPLPLSAAALDAAAAPSTPDKPTLAAAGTSGKKLLAVPADLLAGWDPSAQVQLAFAAEAGRIPSPKNTAVLPAPDGSSASDAEESERSADEGVASTAASTAAAPSSTTATAAAAASAASNPAAAPASSGSDLPPWDRPPAVKQEPYFVRLEDLCHIRTTLARAELENLQFDDAPTYSLVVAGRVCAGCRAKLTLLRRGRSCRVCRRLLCAACVDRTVIPPHMVGSPRPARAAHDDLADVRAGKPILICRACRAELGGVRR